MAVRPPVDPDDPEAAREQAIKLLARREHAPLELRQKLAQRGYENAAIGVALQSLENDRLLSPARFAEVFARSRAARGKGPVLIRAELSARDIDDVTIDAALAEVDAEVDWYELALTERQKRFGPAWPEAFSAQQKQRRFLQQRGFSHEHIRHALEAAKAG